jgi:hypothetical protein
MTTGCSSLYTARDARYMKVFHAWLAAGMVCFVAATALLSGKYIERGVLAYVLTAATIALMTMAARAYVVFLRGADELLRKIQLEALALAFGAGGVFMIGWRLCERLGAPKLDVNDPFVVMAVVWGIGQLVTSRRYAGGGEE